MARTEIVALILAGGQGSRLGVMTKHLAKPAVPYGSRYRIIDFTLSNCTNSGITVVGVLTQYQPLMLNTYIGNGHPWDLDRTNGGTFILPPYQSTQRSDWYKGTANAIYQNIEFIENYEPSQVLILSGDHIYKMDYARMLQAHLKAKADATIAVLEVPWADAKRFGIMNTDESGQIMKFVEKPSKPRSNLASMGVYIFDWDILRRKLVEDEANGQSSHDFGQDIIPSLLDEGRKLSAYRFQGYWKDVGTIASLWEANMDILDCPEELNFSDRNWRIYSRNPVKPPHYVAAGARVVNCALTDGCGIYGTVEHSVLANSVIVESGAVVRDSVLMPGVKVQAGAFLDKCIVGMETIIGKNVRAGASISGPSPYLNTRICSGGITVFDRGLKIRDNAVIPGNSMVECPAGKDSDEAVEYRFRVK
ncbi:MAG TPA: glucose-1-phosphate adenylyltransferase [Clostridiales bacterium]|nr:glucose-1-phosphate adenylyltransferase [Clostridiales bacterium]